MLVPLDAKWHRLRVPMNTSTVAVLDGCTSNLCLALPSHNFRNWIIFFIHSLGACASSYGTVCAFFLSLSSGYVDLLQSCAYKKTVHRFMRCHLYWMFYVCGFHSQIIYSLALSRSPDLCVYFVFIRFNLPCRLFYWHSLISIRTCP